MRGAAESGYDFHSFDCTEKKSRVDHWLNKVRRMCIGRIIERRIGKDLAPPVHPVDEEVEAKEVTGQNSKLPDMRPQRTGLRTATSALDPPIDRIVVPSGVTSGRAMLLQSTLPNSLPLHRGLA